MYNTSPGLHFIRFQKRGSDFTAPPGSKWNLARPSPDRNVTVEENYETLVTIQERWGSLLGNLQHCFFITPPLSHYSTNRRRRVDKALKNSATSWFYSKSLRNVFRPSPAFVFSQFVIGKLAIAWARLLSFSLCWPKPSSNSVPGRLLWINELTRLRGFVEIWIGGRVMEPKNGNC